MNEQSSGVEGEQQAAVEDPEQSSGAAMEQSHEVAIEQVLLSDLNNAAASLLSAARALVDAADGQSAENDSGAEAWDVLIDERRFDLTNAGFEYFEAEKALKKHYEAR